MIQKSALKFAEMKKFTSLRTFPSISLLLLSLSWTAAGCGDDASSNAASDAKILSFEVSPEFLAAPGEANISWQTSGAASLRLMNGDAAIELGDAPIDEGSMEIFVEESSTLTLIAADRMGRPTTASRSIVVEGAALPLLGRLDAPELAELNEEGVAHVLIAWSGVVGADRLVLAWGEHELELDHEAEAGERGVSIDADTTFTLRGENQAGERILQATVRVVGLPSIARFTSNRLRLGTGETATLEWTTEWVSRVELWMNDVRITEVDPEPSLGSHDVTPLMNSKLELRAFNELDTIASETLELVIGSPVIHELSLSSATLWLGEHLELSWETEGGSQLTITDQESGETVCELTDYKSIEASTCRWQPSNVTLSSVVFQLGNSSGVVSETREFFVGTGPLVEFFAASPQAITAADDVHLSWRVRPDPEDNLPTLTLTDDHGNTYSASGAEGSIQAPLADPDLYVFSLVADTTDPRSSPSIATATVEVHPRPEISSLVATPAHFDDAEAQEVTLSWTTSDAASLTLYRLVGGELVDPLEIPASDREEGAWSFVPEEETVFRLVATNSIGGSAFDDVTITIAPLAVISLLAEPSSFTQGQSVVLSWQTQMADEVHLDIAGRTYLREETAAPYLDLEGNGGSRLPLAADCGPTISTDGCATLHFPDDFFFPFGGTDYARAVIYTSGALSLSQSVSATSIGDNQAFPTEPDAAWSQLAPFWDGLAWDTRRYPEGNIFYELRDEGGERAIVIQWKDVGFKEFVNARLNFEVILWENGSFEYRYGVMSKGGSNVTSAALAGASATIGFQLPDQSDWDMIADSGRIPMLGAPAQRSFSYRQAPTNLPRSGEMSWSPYAGQQTLTATLTATRGGVERAKSITLDVSRKPIIEFSPEAIAPALVGDPFLLGWRTYNATALTIVDGDGNLRYTAPHQAAVTEGLVELDEALPGFHRYTVRAEGAHGFIHEQTIEVIVYGGFGIRSFTADKETVEEGTGVLLSWETFNVAEVQLLANGVEIMSALDREANEFWVDSVEEDIEFTLVATDELGVTTEETLLVKIWELSLDVTVSETKVRPGQPVTVTIDARRRDGGGPAQVFGLLPLIDISGSSPLFSDISEVEGAQQHTVGDSSVHSIDLPDGFAFPYLDGAYTSLWAFADGYLTFTDGTALRRANNVPLPSTANQAIALAPFWDDLHPRSTGTMWTAAVGDTFVIQWSKMSLARGSANNNSHDLNFQVVLFRDGSFEYRYGVMKGLTPPNTANTCLWNLGCDHEANGASATIGYQFAAGTKGHTFHFGSTVPDEDSLQVFGGLENRSFRYDRVDGSGTLVFHPDKSETFEFCALSGSTVVCKSIEVEVEFGFQSVALSDYVVPFGGSSTLSWTSVGGEVIRVWREGSGTPIEEIDVLGQVAAGSLVLHPSFDATYFVELLAGPRRDVFRWMFEVERLGLSAEVGQSTGPGAAVTLSWQLEKHDGATAPIVAAPMEEVFDAKFQDLDISNDPDAVTLIGAGADNTAVTLEFDGGFTFPYFGEVHDSIRVTTDGHLAWDTAVNSAPNNIEIPAMPLNPTSTMKTILPFWDDLRAWTEGRVFAKLHEDGDRYVIQWSRMSLKYGSANDNQGDLNFMVVLHKDGSFEYRYGLMLKPPKPVGLTACYPNTCELESNGSSATIGYQAADGQIGHQLHFGGTNRAAGQRPVAGGLSERSWRFTPRSGSGSVQVHPSDTTSYRLCAFEATNREIACATTVEVEVPWGIDFFAVSSETPLPGEELTLSWGVHGLDSLRLLADGVELESYTGASIPALGTFKTSPTGPTTYTLSGSSLGRTVEIERTIRHRGFDLVVTGPSGGLLPEEPAVVNWQATKLSGDDLVMITPMGEIEAGPGAPGRFVDVSKIEGATEVRLSGPKGSGDVPLPFTFPYLGTEQTHLRVFANGYLSFAPNTGDGNGKNTLLPSATAANQRIHLAVFWADLVVQGKDTIWVHQPDPETLIVQWKHFNLVAGSSASDLYDLNFQVVLRADGRFEYRYGEMKPPPQPFSSTKCLRGDCMIEANGSNSTIGYQNLNGTQGSTLHIGDIHTVHGGFGASVFSEETTPFPGGLSGRSFAYSPATIGSSAVVISRSGALEVCGVQGTFSMCKSAYLQPVAEQGDMVITEVMIDPAGGVPEQWLELRNIRNRAIDLDGFVLRSNQGSHRINGSLVVEPGTFVTLASSDQVGFTPDYIYGPDVSFNRLFDTIDLEAGGLSLVTMRWAAGDWSLPKRETLSLDSRFHQQGMFYFADADQWCSGGMVGSPGSLGPSCSSGAYSIDPTSPRPFIDISTTGTRWHDIEGGSRLAKLPPTDGPISFFGQNHFQLWASSYGWISFSKLLPVENPTAPTPLSLPRPASSRVLGPLVGGFWSTLYCDRKVDDCKFYFQSLEIDNQDVLILQWDRYRMADLGSVTFQIQLWGSGDVIVAFGQIDNPYTIPGNHWTWYRGNTAWVGIEAQERSEFINGHFRRITDLEHRSFHFRRE